MGALSYRARTWDSTRTIYASGAFASTELTPLDDLIAPDLYRLPRDIGRALRSRFWRAIEAAPTYDRSRDAHADLRLDVAAFMGERLDVAFDDYALADTAKHYAGICSKMGRLEVMQEWARSHGVDPPLVGQPRVRTRISCARRLQSPKWWRRALRSHWTRQGENHLRAVGIVQKRRQIYASDHMVNCRAGRQARNSKILKDLLAVSDAGDQLELFEIAKGSQSNPAIRRAELMVRLRGFEEVARERGDGAQFFTLTCPSAFHATHSNGAKNDRFENFTPREAQAWLCRMWARARSKLARLSVTYYGFRIAEPHHDGTPHWHMVLFASKADAATLQTVIRAVWLSEYRSESGALVHRVKVQPIDPSRGSAAGYLAKYVAKNIDGFEVGRDLETEKTDASKTSERVQSWASCHGIRQFQQIGGPAVTLWREVRRMRQPVKVAPIEALRTAADAGSYAGFIGANGGIARGRRGACAVWSEVSGEINAYDELRAPSIVGVECSAGRVTTRDKSWRIVRREDAPVTLARMTGRRVPVSLPPLGPVTITVRQERSVPTVGIEHRHASSSIRGSPWMN